MGGERIVVNASPLILLAKIDALPLLEGTASEIVVPAAVRAEIEEGPTGRRDVSGLFARERLRVVPDLPVAQEIVEWDLGAGESQVLAFASESAGWEAALDDLERPGGGGPAGERLNHWPWPLERPWSVQVVRISG